MIRYGNLWSQVTDWQNLYCAARKAQRGKRYRDNVLAFNYNLENELFTLQYELRSRTYQPGAYRTFRILDPKPRLISAAPYRDRVVHHALCNVIVPLIEKTFISDSYANRVGYGTHRALKRFTEFARGSKYVLQCDIAKYFPSIDHQVLKQILRRKLKCQDTLWLIDTIVDNSNAQEVVPEFLSENELKLFEPRRKGLPIGNLTSQFFANCYLNGFDHFVKEKLKASKYLRYVDDFALFSDDYDYLQQAWLEIQGYLATLRLTLHPVKTQLFATENGANFVGFRILPDRIRVRSDNLRRARKRLQQYEKDYAAGLLSLKQLKQNLQSWQAHLNHGDTYRLQQQIWDKYQFVRFESKVQNIDQKR